MSLRTGLGNKRKACETQQDPISLRCPKLALPKDVGTPYGTAPVFAASVKWTDAGSEVDQNWLDTVEQHRSLVNCLPLVEYHQGNTSQNSH